MVFRTTQARFTTSQAPSAGAHLDRITRLYKDAIELNGMRGYGNPPYYLAFFSISSTLSAWFLGGLDNPVNWVVILILPLLGASFTLFVPDETPLIFDRRNQKVYWAKMRGNWRRFFLLPTHMQSFDWSQISAEYQTSTRTQGNNVEAVHHLVFMAHDAQGRLTDKYTIRDIGSYRAPMLWNYVHSYMNHKNKPKPRDVPHNENVVFTYRTIALAHMPYFEPARFKKMWTDSCASRILAVCMCIFAPWIVLVWLPVYLFTKLLADITRQKLYWPRQILDNLGQIVAPVSDKPQYTDEKPHVRRVMPEDGSTTSGDKVVK